LVGPTCHDTENTCDSSAGPKGVCITTTGNAGYCFTKSRCSACSKDVECEPVCGVGAACAPCDGECLTTGGMVCLGFGPGPCSAS
jgi:hypothetical protein